MNLKKFEKTVFLLAMFSVLASIVIGLVCWYMFASVVELGPIWSTIMTMVVWIIAATMLGYQMSKSALAPVSALYRALDHVSTNATFVAPPNPDEHTLSKDLVEQILQDVYSLSSGQNEALVSAKDSSELNQAILDLTSSPIIGLDRNNLIKFANVTAKDIMPASVEKAEGMLLSDALAPEFSSGKPVEEWISEIQGAKIKDQHVWERVRVQSGNGTYLYFDVVADYNKNETHGIETLLVFLNKTSSYHNDDSAVNFVSLAVHELRSPISLLRGYIEVFEDELKDKLDADQQGFMSKMSASAAQLSTFVNNILNVARIENDQLKLHLHEEDISEVLESSRPDFELRATVRNRKLIYKVEEHLPNVGLDTVGIYEVLSNLIDNAIKYSPDEGEITVSAFKNEGGVTVSVRDNGVGIPSSSMENLFERFYRSHHSKEKVSGTGLGLFLSKTLIEAHGGKIWVKSTEGDGSTFGFDLPAYQELAEAEANGGTEVIRSAHGWIKNHGKVSR